jgi:cell division protein FtsW (lipid II flippase)
VKRRRGWERWTRSIATVVALSWCALLVVYALFARTMAAAFEQDDTSARLGLLLIIPAATGAILIHRRPAAGVAALFVAACGAGLIALLRDPSFAWAGLPVLVAALLAMVEPRPDPADDEPGSMR